MTAAEFIDALEAKQLLPAGMVEKLRKKVNAAGSKPLTAKSLARFLIERGHLSKQDVVAALAAGGEIESSPEPEPASTGEPSGVELPMDQLQDLSSSAEWSMEESAGSFSAPDEVSSGGTKIAKKKKKKGKQGNEWDSPLLLIGGGALVLMLIIGPLIAYIMFAENADNILAEARKGMQEGSYGNAIANYERFVNDYEGNAEYSAARVELAMARIRQTLETGNEELAFKTAEEELRDIADEQAFNVAEEDLSDLLPRIARGLADRAEASDAPETTQAFFEKATAALGMANNTKYIPKSRRDNTDLEEIRATLDRIQRRQQSFADLEKTLVEMDALIASGDTGTAYAAQEELLEKHPSLIGNERLSAALQKVSASEQQSIKYVEEPIEAATEEPESAVLATLAVANRREQGEAPTGGVFCTQVDGVAYGLDASTGSLLWRRYAGPSLDPMHPLTIEDDMLLVEWQPIPEGGARQSLSRVDAATGSLEWRLTLDDQVAAPVVIGDRVLLAGESGKLHVVDAKTGTRTGYVQFAQPLRTSPTANFETGVIYLAGDHSSVYTLLASDFSCIGVHYTNHARESIVAPIAVVLDKVVLVENDGAETCKLHLYSVDAAGALSELLTEQRLVGRVVHQPLVDGRRVTVLTDRGAVAVFETSVGPDGDPLTLLASRAERNARPFVRYGQVADGHVWVAENALSRYAISPTGNRLSVVPLSNDYNRSQFVSPLETRDGVLFHTRARSGRAGFTVTACSTSDGAAFWATDIGVPPAGEPLASNSPVALLQADANGNVFRFDPEAMRTRVQDSPIANPTEDARATVYEYAELLPGGAAVFASAGTDHALLYSPSGSKPLSKVNLASALACRPTAFGEGWIAPLSVGQVFYLDAGSGAPLAAPFQPPLEAGRSIQWQPAAVVDRDQLLLSDGVSQVYLLEVRRDGSPMLVAAAETALSAPLTRGFAAVGDVAVAVAEDGQMVLYQLPSLDTGEPIDPGGRVIWGPHSAGERAVLATANNLMAIDGQGNIAWQVPLTIAKIAGVPLTIDNHMVVASQSGDVVRINLADGTEVARVSAGEPLAAGPVLLNSRVVVAARDSSLLVLESP